MRGSSINDLQHFILDQLFIQWYRVGDINDLEHQLWLILVVVTCDVYLQDSVEFKSLSIKGLLVTAKLKSLMIQVNEIELRDIEET